MLQAIVARIGADFIDRFNARREACEIAERNGVNVGSVFLAQARTTPAASSSRAPPSCACCSLPAHRPVDPQC
ncbi:MAG: hypothetical protein ABI520_03595 [Caldimonas sp.]